MDRPSQAALYGLLAGTGLATLAALGPLVSAITITVAVETQVGNAAGLPDARMQPAALEGVGAVALIFLPTRRPTGGLRAWCAALILVSLGAGMAAQGTHAVWYDARRACPTLGTEQVEMVARLASSGAGVECVEAGPGTGKTTALGVYVAACRRAGTR